MDTRPPLVLGTSRAAATVPAKTPKPARCVRRTSNVGLPLMLGQAARRLGLPSPICLASAERASEYAADVIG